MRAPTNNRITQGKHGTYNAVDYSSSPDSTFYAPEDGKITAYGDSGTCGNRLELTSGGNRHGFCHLERPLVSVGQTVSRGQPIGVMGYTGYTEPSGPAGRHLHWVIRQGNVYIYPPTLVNEPFIGGEMANRDQVNTIYRAVLGRDGDPGGLDHYTGKDANVIVSDMLNSQERKNRDAYFSSLEKTVADLQTALANEKAKPPVEVVKTVEKVVEKVVEKPVVKEVEVNPSWLETAIQFVRKVLRIN